MSYLCFFVYSGSFRIAKQLPKPMSQTLRKSSKYPPRHLPKSMPKPPKIDPKTLPKSRCGGGPLIELEILPSWGTSWGVLGTPGGVLGASWRHLGVVLGILGLLGSVLGPSWGRLGDVLGRISMPIQLENDF